MSVFVLINLINFDWLSAALSRARLPQKQAHQLSHFGVTNFYSILTQKCISKSGIF